MKESLPLKSVALALMIIGGQATSSAFAGNETFGFDLFLALRNEDEFAKKNIFFSPYSISTAMAMVYAGARGETKTEIEKVFHFVLPDKKIAESARLLAESLRAKNKNFQFSVANRLWAEKSYEFLPAFLKTTHDDYGAEVGRVDFKAESEQTRKTINQWIEEKTAGKINELLAPGVVSVDERLVLTNAVYFKAKWSLPFEARKTEVSPFWVTEKRSKRVPMMHQLEECRYSETPSLQLLALSYLHGKTEMVIVLPKYRGGLTDLETTFLPTEFEGLLKQADLKEVDVYFPKFRATSSFALERVLSRMGMKSAFVPHVPGSSEGADLSGMTGDRDLYLGLVVHKAFVDLNEEGTEAAAVTAFGARSSGAAVQSSPPTFRADHPFLYFIRDVKTGTVLFFGRMIDPMDQ